MWKPFNPEPLMNKAPPLNRDYSRDPNIKAGFIHHGSTFSEYLEVHCTYNLLSNCSYNPSISRATVVMGFTIGL